MLLTFHHLDLGTVRGYRQLTRRRRCRLHETVEAKIYKQQHKPGLYTKHQAEGVVTLLTLCVVGREGKKAESVQKLQKQCDIKKMNFFQAHVNFAVVKCKSTAVVACDRCKYCGFGYLPLVCWSHHMTEPAELLLDYTWSSGISLYFII